MKRSGKIQSNYTMKIIIGLGNPGEHHAKQRHNFGFMVLNALFKDYATPKENFKEEKKFQAEIAEINWQPKKGKEERVILVKPLTFMNGSGSAVSAVAKFYKVDVSDIWVVHDEIDLPLGAMKIRLGGSSAGHKGIESIIEHLKSDKFWRFRLGIGEQKVHKDGKLIKHIDSFVLGEFGESEKGKMREMIKKAVKALENSLEQDMEKTMNKFNTK